LISETAANVKLEILGKVYKNTCNSHIKVNSSWLWKFSLLS